MKSFWFLAKPNMEATLWPNREKKLVLAGVTPGSQVPSPENTTMSPRWTLPNSKLSLSTSTRSPMARVFCIEPDGM